MEDRIIGRDKPIHDAYLKVTGRKQYTGDMKLPGMLYGRILFSPVAHARIKHIDLSEALEMPGVYAAVSYENTPQNVFNSAKRFIDQNVICNEKIFDDTVRFVGDRVAAVAAESEAIAAEALKKIKVEYEMLPVVTTIDEAIKEDAYPIHPGGNIVMKMEAGTAEGLEEAFESCDYVCEGRYTTPPIHHAAIELHTAIADWTPDDMLTVYSPNQNSFAFRVILSDIFGLPYNHIRVVSPGLGGAFGGKLEVTAEPVAAVLSRACGRPVKVMMTRGETMTATRVRHPSENYVKMGFMKDGTIKAVDFKIYTNTGAYASSALNVAGALLHKVFGAYKIEHMHIMSIPVYTNTETGGAMRGYGSPQVYFGFERQVNKIANFLHLDPAFVQRKNMVDPDSLNPLSGARIGNPRPKDCLDRAMELIHYEEAVERQAKSRKENGRYAYGVGVALGVHGNNCFGAHRDNVSPMIKMNEDGSCILYSGSHEMGNDTVGMQAQIVSDILGITIDRINVIYGDTQSCLWHIGDYSSRGAFVIGAAVKKTAEIMRGELASEAAKLLKAEPEEICFAGNQAFVENDRSRSASIHDVMVYCQSVSMRELCVHTTYQAPRGAFSYGVHIAAVEVDRENGNVKVKQYAAVHDVGAVLNPMMLAGQLQGGVFMGLGYALSEEIKYDKEGNPSPKTLKRYGAPRTTDAPEEFRIDFIAGNGGEPGGPYGAKAMGESPVVPVAPAVVNAVCNALDIEIDDIPALPERIRERLKEKTILFKEV